MIHVFYTIAILISHIFENTLKQFCNKLDGIAGVLNGTVSVSFAQRSVFNIILPTRKFVPDLTSAQRSEYSGGKRFKSVSNAD